MSLKKIGWFCFFFFFTCHLRFSLLFLDPEISSHREIVYLFRCQRYEWITLTVGDAMRLVVSLFQRIGEKLVRVLTQGRCTTGKDFTLDEYKKFKARKCV